MKFDLRKYIFANVTSILAYGGIILSLVYYNMEFPAYQPGWGEGPVPSFEEQQFLFLMMTYSVFGFCSFLLLFIEILIKFLFRKFVRNKPFFIELKFPKPIVIIYSIFFYIGLLFFSCTFILAVIDSI